MRCLLPWVFTLGAMVACDSFEPDPENVGINCKDSVCLGQNSCCVQRVNLQFEFQCLQDAAACGGFALTCDGPEDCDGRPCCIRTDDAAMGDPPPAACADVCATGFAPMCHAAADCPDALDCINKDVFGGYGVCFDG